MSDLHALSSKLSAMPKYAAFLRAINVGGHTVKMDHLRELFEQMGFASAETFIASGNVIFDSKSKNTKALERTIERGLREALGYEVATFIRSIPEVEAVARYQAFPDLDADGIVLYVGFVANGPDEEATRRLLSLTTTVDDFHISGREVYWLNRRALGESTLPGAKVEKMLGMPLTLRNVNTVRRMALKYSPDAKSQPDGKDR